MNRKKGQDSSGWVMNGKGFNNNNSNNKNMSAGRKGPQVIEEGKERRARRRGKRGRVEAGGREEGGRG